MKNLFFFVLLFSINAIAQSDDEKLTVNQQKTILALNGPNEKKPSPVALYRKNAQVNTRFAAEWLSSQYKTPLNAWSLKPGDDRYIGGTEDNLMELFDKAKESNSVLFFDEADALFGKAARTEEQEKQAKLLIKLAKTYPGGIIFHCRTEDTWYALAKAGFGIVSLD